MRSYKPTGRPPGRPPGKKEKSTAALNWLEDLLTTGDKPANEVKRRVMSENPGFSWITLLRVKQHNRIQSYHGSVGGEWFWTLKTQAELVDIRISLLDLDPVKLAERLPGESNERLVLEWKRNWKRKHKSKFELRNWQMFFDEMHHRGLITGEGALKETDEEEQF